MPDAGASPLHALARVRPHLTDGELLTAFVHRRDAEAFAALVRRLGPRVLAVCRRITGHAHDADDAFQAVFLVLARRAAAVRPPEAVAGWVYGVAVRTAQDARAMAARRRSRVTPTATVPDVPVGSASPPDAEHLAALDGEIARLPDHLRAAVVLCELDGVSRKDAAKRLRIAEGTLSSRLAAARRRLAAALARRGVALGAVLTAAADAPPASGSGPLFAAAARWGGLVAGGEPIPAGAASALADRVSRIMLLTRLKPLLVASACGLFALATGWGMLTRLPAADPLPKAEPVKPAEPATKPVNKLVIWKTGEVVTLDPDGKNEKTLFEREEFEDVTGPVLSPDGKTLAYFSTDKNPRPDARPGSRWMTRGVVLREVGAKEANRLDVTGAWLAWSPDGKELLVTTGPQTWSDDRQTLVETYGPQMPISPRSILPPPTATVIDVRTKKATEVKLPADHYPVGFAPDGKGLLTMRVNARKKRTELTACLLSRDGKEETVLTDPDYMAADPKLSPDGKTVLFVGTKRPGEKDERWYDGIPRLFAQPVGGKVAEVAGVAAKAEMLSWCWSPDGKKIAYVWREITKDPPPKPGEPDEREMESHLVVCDPDGKNAKTVLSEKGKGLFTPTLNCVSWR